jgi:hypothetical protein
MDHPLRQLDRPIGRDLRIDFFRGLALLFIFTNHLAYMVDQPFLKLFSWRQWGVSGGAELFVFLSGYVFGLVYSRRLATQGFKQCQAKAVIRSLQLYLANLATLLVVWGIVAYAVARSGRALDLHGVEFFMNEPAAAITRACFLDAYPYGFDVLGLYCVLVVFMPGLLWIFLRRPLAAVGISVGLYSVAQFVIVPEVWGHGWGMRIYFNPLAWQLLFFLAMAIAVAARKGGMRIAGRPWAVALSGSLVLAMFIWRIAAYGVRFNLAGMGALGKMIAEPLDWADRTNLEPLLLVYFFAMVYLVALVLPKDLSLWRHWMVQPVIRCGQNSLKIFCVGIILAFGCSMAIQAAGSGYGVGCLAAYGGWAVLMALAVLIHKCKTMRRPSVEDEDMATSTASLLR